MKSDVKCAKQKLVVNPLTHAYVSIKIAADSKLG